MYKLQSKNPRQNQKQIKLVSNKLSMLQTEKRVTRSAKKNKNNFISVIGDKFTMIIRWVELTTAFCKNLFSCINYLHSLI